MYRVLFSISAVAVIRLSLQKPTLLITLRGFSLILGALLKWHIYHSLHCLEETSLQVHNMNCNGKEIDYFKSTRLLCRWLSSAELHSPAPFPILFSWLTEETWNVWGLTKNHVQNLI